MRPEWNNGESTELGGGGSVLYLLSALAMLDSELPLPPVHGPVRTPSV